MQELIGIIDSFTWIDVDQVIEHSEMTNIKVILDSIETEKNCTINDFIKLVNQTQNAKTDDEMICYSNGVAILSCGIVSCDR